MKQICFFKPCVKCGAVDRYKDGKCKACSVARNAAYYDANAEKIKATGFAYCVLNRDKRRAYAATYRAANPEIVKAKIAEWYAANTEKMAAYFVAYRAANREKANARTAAWRQANPAARRINEQNRRARKVAAGGVLSKGLSVKLFTSQKGKCPCCKQPLGDDHHLDHVMPLALGGTNTDDNMQLLRKRCNLQKQAKHPTQYMQEKGFLL